MKRIGFLFLVALLLAGCVNNQAIVIDPTVMGPHTAEGKGVTVALVVLDQRPTKLIGQRDRGRATITTNSDIVAIIRDRIKIVLQERGFTVVNGNAASPVRLTVQIRKLHYSSANGWVYAHNVQATIRVVATRSGLSYKKMYRYSDESHSMNAHKSSTNARLINSALGSVLTELADDQKLVNFLISG